MLRIRDGRFCVELPAGRYRLSVSPLDFDRPDPSSVTVLLPEGGAKTGLTLAGAEGRRRLRVKVESAGSFDPGEVFLAAWVEKEGASSYSYARARAGREALLAYPDAPLRALGVRGRMGAALAPVWRTTEQGAQAEVVMTPSALLTGRVLFPDGAPFRPRVLPVEERSLYRVAFLDPSRSRGVTALADSDGRYELSAPLGVGYLDSWQEGSGGRVTAGPLALARLEAGARTVDVRVAERSARLTFKGRGAAPVGGRLDMLFGGPRGALARITPSACSQEALDVFMIRDADGRWSPRDIHVRGEGEERYSVWVDTGEYDFIATTARDLPYPSLRVLGRLEGVRLVPGDNEIALSEDPPTGRARLEGETRAAATLESIDGARDVDAFCLAFFPQLELLDAGGRLVATAGASLSKEELDEAFAAYARRDAADLRRILGESPRGLRLAGLPPGRYRYRLRRAARAEATGVVVLEDEKTATLALPTD